MKKLMIIIFSIPVILIHAHGILSEPDNNGKSDREYWIKILTKIADPVLENLSKNELKKNMPVEASSTGNKMDREKVTYLEAFGRLLAGMAPWLELGPVNTAEGILREKYIELSVKSIKNAVDPKANDFMNFNQYSRQPLVDAAFLAHALIRAPKQLWGNLDDETKSNLISALKSTRTITPWESNWLLFSAMVEAALLKFDGEWEIAPVQNSIDKHAAWYKGDGLYGDGPNFHWDYYNSYVIQPMLLDILKICKENNIQMSLDYDTCLKRSKRYAAIQERLISPEGTFPPIGRSLPYRVGAFQLLGQISLMHELPENIKPSQVRCALTAVIKNMMEAPGTFDKNGWLQIGFYGHQPDIGESYISTGSLYLCSVGFLPLGLNPDDEFWSGPDMDWTSKAIWKGLNIKTDHAIEN